MIEGFKMNGKAYLMETFGLAGFVIGAGLLTIVLEHPDLWVMKSSIGKYAFIRRIPLGIIMGAYIMFVVLAIGKKSGAHINPAVTWTFFRLGKIHITNGILYTIAQFAGAIIGAQLLKIVLGKWFSHPVINFGYSAPKPPHGTAEAFIAEFIISFIMMLVVLRAGSSKKFEKYTAVLSGALIALFLIIELPYSGMSLNPARSFAASLAADKWEHLWLYFLAPVLAMLAAAEVYLQWKKNQLLKIKKLEQENSMSTIHSDYIEIPEYPRNEKTQ